MNHLLSLKYDKRESDFIACQAHHLRIRFSVVSKIGNLFGTKMKMRKEFSKREWRIWKFRHSFVFLQSVRDSILPSHTSYPLLTPTKVMYRFHFMSKSNSLPITAHLPHQENPTHVSRNLHLQRSSHGTAWLSETALAYGAKNHRQKNLTISHATRFNRVEQLQLVKSADSHFQLSLAEHANQMEIVCDLHSASFC